MFMATCDSRRSVDGNLQPLLERVTCNLCQELYKDARILPCLHYYCKSCLEDKTRHSSVILCPKCSQTHELRETDIQRLPSVFLAEEPRILHSLAPKKTNSGPVCELCKNPSESKACAYCFHCSKHLCPFCKEAHERLKPYAAHTVFKLNEKMTISEGINFAEAAMKTLSLCTDHEREMKIYCFECSETICRGCQMDQHKRHRCESLNTISENICTELEAKKKLLQENYAKLEETRLNIEKTLLQMKEEGIDAKSFVNRSFDLVLQQFEKYRSNLLKSIENKMKSDSKGLQMEEKDINSTLKRTESLVHFIEGKMGNNEKEELVAVHKMITQQVSEIQKLCHERKQFVENPDWSFTIYKTSCARIIGAIGDSLKCADPIMTMVKGPGAKYAEVNKEATFIVNASQSYEVPCLVLQNVQAEVNSIDDCGSCKTRVDVVKGNLYEVVYTPKVQGQHILKVKINGRAVVGSPFEVLVKRPIQDMNDPILVIGGVKKLGDIAIHRKGTLIATQYEEGAIVSIDKKGNFIKKLLNRAGRPYGIATNRHGEIFVTQTKKCCLQKYDKHLELVETVGCKEGTIGNFKRPGRLALNKRSDVFVCDAKTSRIQVFDADLDYLRWYSISKPTGVTLNSDGDLYTTESGKNTLSKILDSSRLGTMKLRDELSGPQGVYNDEDYIYVTEKEKAQVTVLNHEGDFVTTLGQGILKEPGAIVGDEDGYIYVCDEQLEAIYVF